MSDKEANQDVAQIWAQDEYRFHGQRPSEHVLLVKNQHLIVLLPLLIVTLLSLVVPYFLLRLFDGRAMTYSLIVYGALVAIYLAYCLYGYKNSVSVVSDQRILNVIQKGFFNRKISEAELERIQDVSTDIKGILQTLFGFGDVTIRTASETLLVLKNIDDPYSVQQTIVRTLKTKK